MSNALCKTAVLKIYQDVIDDVINGVRELFLEEGVDEQVLQELRQTWETKLTNSKAVQNEIEKKAKKQEIITSNGFAKPILAQSNNSQTTTNHAVAPPPSSTTAAAAAAATTTTTTVQTIVETKMVPIQITLPPQPGTEGQRVLTIQVPATALQGNQLQRILTGPVITATMGLPPAIASSLLQQHVNASFNSQQHQQQQHHSVTVVNKNLAQTDGMCDLEEESDDEENNKKKKKNNIEIEFILPKKLKKQQHQRQIDGSMDTSDEGSDGTDDDNDDEDLDEDKDDEDQEIEDEGGEEGPLNSEDDVSDDDPTDLFDTDNIVVCQYDKIDHIRNKWKFILKDGIMNLSGMDYVFLKANGDAEW